MLFRSVRDPKTSKPSLSRVLGPEDRGRDVRLVQHLVMVVIDGYYGPQTTAAVKAWQAKRNLEADGYFGPRSCAAAGWIWKGTK